MSWCAVGLHPRRNSNTTSVVCSYYVSTVMQAAARRLIIAVGANPRSEEYENIFFIVAATRRHKIAGGVVGYDKNPRNIDYCRGCEPTEHELENTNPLNTNPRNTNLIVFFILIKKSVVYFTGIKNLRFTSPPILCHHFVVAFVIIVVASTRWLIFAFLCFPWVCTHVEIQTSHPWFPLI